MGGRNSIDFFQVACSFDSYSVIVVGNATKFSFLPVPKEAVNLSVTAQQQRRLPFLVDSISIWHASS